MPDLIGTDAIQLGASLIGLAGEAFAIDEYIGAAAESSVTISIGAASA